MLNAQGPQELSLLGTPRGGEDLGTHPLGDAYRGLPDAPGGGVDQDPLSLRAPAELTQGIVRGEKGDRDRRRLLEAQALWLRHHKGGARRHERAQAGRGEGYNAVPHLETLDALSDRQDLSRTLEPDVHRVLEHWGDEAHRDQDVPEVQADCPNPNLHLPERRLPASGLPQHQRIQDARLRNLQPERLLPGY